MSRHAKFMIVCGTGVLTSIVFAARAGGAPPGKTTPLLDLKKSVGDGRWDKGTWDGGLALKFDMGTKRANWNHGRWAVCAFKPARDLSGCDGLRVRVSTDKPRGDAEVCVWLGEADGSWYHIRYAVPLVDKANEGYLPLEDFTVAEWCCPGRHMDEDYVLDTKSIGAIAIGVLNPLGVGEVSFKVTAIDLVATGRKPEPAHVTVTGRTLSINAHDKIPAGVFGGYAYHIKHKYRPGCQRNLSAPTHPQIPRRYWLGFNPHSFPDWQAMMIALRGGSEPHKAMSAHLMKLLKAGEDTRGLRSFERFSAERYLESIRKHNANPGKPGRWRPRDPKAAPRELIWAMNALIHDHGLYDRNVFAKVALGDKLKAMLAGLDQLSDTEVMTANRRLGQRVIGLHPDNKTMYDWCPVLSTIWAVNDNVPVTAVSGVASRFPVNVSL